MKEIFTAIETEKPKPKIEEVTSKNWKNYFPNKSLSLDTKELLDKGVMYVQVALDCSNSVLGWVEVRKGNNVISMEVDENHRNEGVGTILMHKAQKDFSELMLLTSVKEPFMKHFLKDSGFAQIGSEAVTNFYAWKK